MSSVSQDPLREIVPVFRPQLPGIDQLADLVRSIDTRQVYSNFGPLVMELEGRLAEYIGVPKEHVATVSSGTLALEGAIETLSETYSECELQLPSWTFTATASAALRVRGTATFRDVDASGRLVESEPGFVSIETLPWGAHLKSSTFAWEVPRIVDAAASFDAMNGIGMAFTQPTLVMVSLHATKCLPAGEGAFVFSNDAEWIQRIRQWTNFGMWGDRQSRSSGTNAKMSEYSAAVALASLHEWPSAQADWHELLERSRALSREFNLSISEAAERNLVSPYWIIQVETKKQRSSLREVLEANGIGYRFWWERGCHRMPAYAHFQTDKLPQTEILADTTMGLPLFRGMSNHDWELIEKALNDFVLRL